MRPLHEESGDRPPLEPLYVSPKTLAESIRQRLILNPMIEGMVARMAPLREGPQGQGRFILRIEGRAFSVEVTEIPRR